jgi:hypothetical protein
MTLITYFAIAAALILSLISALVCLYCLKRMGGFIEMQGEFNRVTTHWLKSVSDGACLCLKILGVDGKPIPEPEVKVNQ